MRPKQLPYWPVVMGGMIIMAVSHLILWMSLRPMTRAGYGDFSAFYCAGKLVQQGQGRNLYNLERQSALREQILPQAAILRQGLPYFHPAFEALIYAALARLPYDRAYLLWDLAGLAMLLVTLHLLRSQLQPPLNSRVFLLAGALGFFPIAETFVHGQDEMLLWLLFMLACSSMAAGHERLAGILLALALFKFHLVLPVVIILLFQKRWRLFQGFAVGGTATVLLSVAITGIAGAQQYARLMLHLDQLPQDYTAAYTAVMPNLRGTLTTMMSHWVPRLGLRTAVLLLSIAIVLWTGRAVARHRDELKLSYSAALVASLLVSYHANIYDLTLLSLPLLFLVERFLSSAARTTVKAWAIVVLLAFAPVCHLLLVWQCANLLFWPLLGLWWLILVQLKGEDSRRMPADELSAGRKLTPPGVLNPSR